MRKSKSNTKIAKQSFGIIWYMNKQKLRITISLIAENRMMKIGFQ